MERSEETAKAYKMQFINLEYRSASNKEFELFKLSNLGLVDFAGLLFNNQPVEKTGMLI
jgi:hypothetical protein